jgi:hypothetical protein
MLRHGITAFAIATAACGGGSTTTPRQPTPDPTPSAPSTWPLPDKWRTEIIPFPLEFAPDLAHRGVEELRFAPGFFDPTSPGYWSYAFVWRLDDPADLDAAALAAELTTYFRGLVAAVDEQKRVTTPEEVAVRATARPAGGFDLEGRVFDVFGTAAAVDLVGTAERRPCPNGGSLWVVIFHPTGKDAMRSQLDDLARSAACGQTPVAPPPKSKPAE